MMKGLQFIFTAWLLFPALVLGGEREEAYLNQKMIPSARELLQRIGQTNDLPSTANDVQSYKVEFYDDGWVASMQLTNGWGFRFYTDQQETNVFNSHLPGKLEAAYLKETLIPLAQAFSAKVGMNQFTNIGTNQIKRYKHDGYFDDRPGCMADLYLTNKCRFTSYTEKDKSEIKDFQQNQQKTYYSLNDAPVEKIKAVQALLKQNKLSEKKAMALARKYFVVLGHDEKNFRSPEIQQGYWVSGNMKYSSGRLPAFTVTWYRKDVTDAQLKPETGEVYRQPCVEIEVSGIDSSLISYHKSRLPIGSDF